MKYNINFECVKEKEYVEEEDECSYEFN